MSISMIAAVAANGVIGNEGGLPWVFREDMRRFKALTMMSGIVIMGKKTHDSIGRALPGRLNLVITNGKWDSVADGAIALGLNAVKRFAVHQAGEVMVVGGESIYREFLHLADKLYITNINAPYRGDAYFPDIGMTDWTQIGQESYRDESEFTPSASFDVFVRSLLLEDTQNRRCL